MRCFTEFKRLKLNIFKIQIIINVIEQYSIVGRVEHRSPHLDLQRAFELIRTDHFLYIEKHAAFNTFIVGELVARPCPAVDEFIDSSLQGLKYLPVCSLNLLTGDLDVAPEFLCFRSKRNKNKQKEQESFYHHGNRFSKY